MLHAFCNRSTLKVTNKLHHYTSREFPYKTYIDEQLISYTITRCYSDGEYCHSLAIAAGDTMLSKISAVRLMRNDMATNTAPYKDVLWRRGTCYLWIRWTLISVKSCFSNKHKILETRKCYSMALKFTFDTPLNMVPWHIWWWWW